MTGKGNILVGTVGQGVMMSADDGESWTRAGVRQGMHSDCIVRMLRADARRPEVVYAGTDFGLYRSDDGGATLAPAREPDEGFGRLEHGHRPGRSVRDVRRHRHASTPGIFRSTDGGKSWGKLRVDIADECPNVGVPRPTGIAVDPTNDRNVWVGLEVDGVRYSTDGGETWSKLNGQIRNQDVHNVLVIEGPPKTVFTVVNDDIWRSTDDGKSWQAARAREIFPWHYPRGIAVKPGDPRTVFLTLGDSTPGRIGTVVRSRDAGVTWETPEVPGAAELGGLDGDDLGGGAGHDVRGEPLRLSLSQRRRRRLLAQALAGVRRGFFDPVGSTILSKERERMKAIRVSAYGGPSVLKIEEIPAPQPGATQVLVRNHAVGVNPVDTYLRSNTDNRGPKLPYTPGSDSAGVIEAVGDSVTRVKKGDRVYVGGSISGAYAEMTLCEQTQVHELPGNVNYAQGSAMNVPYATAFHALFHRAHGEAGEIGPGARGQRRRRHRLRSSSRGRAA